MGTVRTGGNYHGNGYMCPHSQHLIGPAFLCSYRVTTLLFHHQIATCTVKVLGRNSGFTARFNLLLGTLKVVTAKYLTAALRTVTPLCFDYGSSSVEIWILREGQESFFFLPNFIFYKLECTGGKVGFFLKR